MPGLSHHKGKTLLFTNTTFAIHRSSRQHPRCGKSRGSHRGRAGRGADQGQLTEAVAFALADLGRSRTKIAKLVQIAPITIGFMVLITIVTGAYKPTYNGGAHIVAIDGYWISIILLFFSGKLECRDVQSQSLKTFKKTFDASSMIGIEPAVMGKELPYHQGRLYDITDITRCKHSNRAPDSIPQSQSISQNLAIIRWRNAPNRASQFVVRSIGPLLIHPAEVSLPWWYQAIGSSTSPELDKKKPSE